MVAMDTNAITELSVLGENIVLSRKTTVMEHC